MRDLLGPIDHFVDSVLYEFRRLSEEIIPENEDETASPATGNPGISTPSNSLLELDRELIKIIRNKYFHIKSVVKGKAFNMAKSGVTKENILSFLRKELREESVVDFAQKLVEGKRFL